MGFPNTNAVIKYYANNYLNITVMFENYNTLFYCFLLYNM